MTKTKINHRPAKSVMDCVKEFASAHKTFTIDDVCKTYSGVPKTQISTALWKLRGAGIVAKHEDGMYTVLTDVNKPVGVPKPFVTKPKPTHSEAVKSGMAKTISKLNTEIAEHKKTIARADQVYEDLATRYKVLQSTHGSLRQQHEDALAIIRYLENKLYVALQQVAKNGSNA